MWQQQEPNKSGRQLMRSCEVGVPEESGARTVRARVGRARPWQELAHNGGSVTSPLQM